MADDTQPTQQLTQNAYDPRRLGRNNSGLSESDIADVLCILHPGSPAAYRIVAQASQRTPQHVLQNRPFNGYQDEVPVELVGEEEETFIVTSTASSQRCKNQAQDLALRFSSRTINPHYGFCFGRNAAVSDIVMGLEGDSKRVSNMHFRIFINAQGIVMLEDMSLNGTMVNDVVLKGKQNRMPTTRMLEAGSIIQILSTNPDESIKFIMRIPSRDGYEEEYAARFRAYMQHVAVAEQAWRAQRALQPAVALQQPPIVKPPLLNSNYGMHWNGGDKYNVVGHLGKGAFATVYKLATKAQGELFAAKELEKKRFMKSGILDLRLDNEMSIMQTLSHPNIVQYIDYHDIGNYLYIVMEYVHCGDLQEYMKGHGVLSEELAKSMTRQILHALAYLHRKKITHRDIKPDNILISSEHPFTVKLSDFGLSKVVKNNDTFLKTFCGTLLYCAPEVFPHYDAYMVGQGKKRRRGVATAQPSPHSYGQSVDIWSYAAVLWFVLCNQPPFEGVVDNTGKAMFNKIMQTQLDTTPLQERHISDDAIDLLIKMLNTDPAARPSEYACFRHPWLADGSASPGMEMDIGLDAIPEQEEDELDASQLSLHDRADEVQEAQWDSDAEEGSADFGLLDSRQSKRFKPGDAFMPRQQAELDSSPDASYHSVSIIGGDDSYIVPNRTQGQPQRPRLFGEIGQSALQSSGVLGAHTNLALAMSRHDTLNTPTRPVGNARLSGHSSDARTTGDNAELGIGSEDASELEAGLGAEAASSLEGAVSILRDLHMASPDSPRSQDHSPDEPSTPKTPRTPPPPSDRESASQETPGRPQEATPKQPIFDRRINLPLPDSFFKFPNSRSYGDTNEEAPSLPDTITSSLQDEDNSRSDNTIPITLSAGNEFLRPRPRLGKLTAVPGSFITLTLKLEERITRWGRHWNNSIVYPDANDTRIPKSALEISFHAPGIEKVVADGGDWTKMEGLYTAIRTQSRSFIMINGVVLKKEGEQGQTQYGRLYTGDEICVYTGKDGFLKFRCEIYHGEGSRRRMAGEARFVVQSFAA